MIRRINQGAIDMAQAVLRNGRNAQIRRLAQEHHCDAATGNRGDAACELRSRPPCLTIAPSPTQV